MTKIDAFFFPFFGVIIGCTVFAFDLTQQLGVAGGVPYVLLVLLGLLAERQQVVIALAVAATLLTMLGMHFSDPGAPVAVVFVNRGLALLAIWSVGIAVSLVVAHRRRLEQLLDRDVLTGLYNRRYLLDSLAREIQVWRREQRPLSLVMLDIDCFKRINDRYGHQAGDRVLAAVADTCTRIVRGSDWVCRFGGEEFVIVLPGADMGNAVDIAERLRVAIGQQRFGLGHDSVSVTVSQGVAEVSDRLADAATLLGAADDAMYQAKAAGRNRVSTSADPGFVPHADPVEHGDRELTLNTG